MWSGSAMPGASTVCSGNSGICMRSGSAYDDLGINRAAGHAGGSCHAAGGLGARVGSVSAGARLAGVGLGAEARAAPAARDGVRVVDREAGAHEGVDVVDLAALDERDAVLVDVDAHAVRGEDAVLG